MTTEVNVLHLLQQIALEPEKRIHSWELNDRQLGYELFINGQWFTYGTLTDIESRIKTLLPPSPTLDSESLAREIAMELTNDVYIDRFVSAEWMIEVIQKVLERQP
jgi:hypothetical protein